MARIYNKLFLRGLIERGDEEKPLRWNLTEEGIETAHAYGLSVWVPEESTSD